MTRTSTTTASILVLLLAACAAPTRRVELPRAEGLARPVADARGIQEEARGRWLGSVGELDPAAARAGREEALRLLAVAAELDRGNPLCRSRAGELRLELALEADRPPGLFLEGPLALPEQLAAARADLIGALALAGDWVPGHLGLARLELLRGEPRRALEHTVAAEESLRRLRGLVQRAPTFLELVFGVDLGPVERVDPMGPREDAQGRAALLASYLAAEAGGWESGGSIDVSAVDGALEALSGRLVHLRACAAAQVVLAEGGTRQEALRVFLPGIEEALAHDGDRLAPRLALARALAELGEHERALDLLEPGLRAGIGPVWVPALAARWSLACARRGGKDAEQRLERAVAWLDGGLPTRRATRSSGAWPRPVLERLTLRSELHLERARLLLDSGRAAAAREAALAAREDALRVETNLNLLAAAGASAADLAPARAAQAAHEQAVAALLLAAGRALEGR